MTCLLLRTILGPKVKSCSGAVEMAGPTGPGARPPSRTIWWTATLTKQLVSKWCKHEIVIDSLRLQLHQIKSATVLINQALHECRGATSEMPWHQHVQLCSENQPWRKRGKTTVIANTTHLPMVRSSNYSTMHSMILGELKLGRSSDFLAPNSTWFQLDLQGRGQSQCPVARVRMQFFLAVPYVIWMRYIYIYIYSYI